MGLELVIRSHCYNIIKGNNNNSIVVKFRLKLFQREIVLMFSITLNSY